MEETRQEKIMAKVKKLFALAGNNPSEEEAKIAVLKAQELMVQYGIEMAEIEDFAEMVKAEAIEEIGIDVPSKKWKYTLANITDENFRTKHYFCGKNHIVFVGHSTDVKIATETFQFLFKMGNSLGMKLYNEARMAFKDTTNIYNSCVIGFCAGVKQALGEQSKALMIVTPDDVKEDFAERTRGFRSMHTRAPSAYRADAFNTGKTAGYNAMKRNALEG